MAALGNAAIGFELQNKTNGVEAETFVGTCSIDTATFYGGAASLRVNPSSATGYVQHSFRTDVVSNIYAKFMLYIASAPSVDAGICWYGDSANFYGAKLSLTSARKLKTTNSSGGGAVLGSTTLALNTWYRIEVFYDETASTYTIKLATGDGAAATEINAATVDDVGGGGRFRFGILTAATADLYFDDIEVDDAAYPGPGRVVLAKPSAAGDNAATTGIFSYINEVPSTDTATSGSTMVELDNNPTTADYNVTDTASLGIGSGDTIKEVALLARLREEAAATTSYQLRIKSASGGTVATTTSVDAGNATPRTNPSGTTNFGVTHRLTTDPTTGVAWTPLGTNSIENMQIGISSATANDLWLLGLYAMIVYVPSSGPTYSRTPSDSTTPTESAVRSTVKKPSDSTTPTEAAGKYLVKNIADSATISESATPALNAGPTNHSRTPSDSTTPTESAGKRLVKNVSDSASVSESATPTLNPTPPAASGDILIATVNDDASQTNSGGAVSLTNDPVLLSSSSVQAGYLGFRFTNIDIPQGATINNARLRLYVTASSTSTGSTWQVAAEAADNSAAFAATTNNISARSRTSNAAAPHRTDDLPAGSWIEIDVTDIVQAVINRAGWAANNALSLILHTPGQSSTITVNMSESSNDPQLSIVYDGAALPFSPSASENVGATWSGASDAFSSNNVRALGENSTGDSLTFKNYGIDVDPTDDILDIEVVVEGATSSDSDDARYEVELSWNGGTSWTSPLSTPEIIDTSDGEETYKVSGGPTRWGGHVFTPSELSNANFRVRVTPRLTGATTDAELDYVGVIVHTTVPVPTGTDYQQTPSDSTTPTESVAKTYIKYVSDSAVGSDTAAKSMAAAKTDSSTPTEAVSKRAVLSKADSSTPTESSVRSYGLIRADSSGSADAIVKTTVLNKSDSTTPLEAAIKAVQASRADSSTPTESVSKAVKLNKADSTTPTDSFSKLVAFIRAIADSSTPTESVSKSYVKNLADSATISEFSLQTIIIILLVSDSTTITDAVSKKTVKVVQDSSTSSDNVTKAFGKQVADLTTPTDATSKKTVKSPLDSSTSSDAISKAYGRKPADSSTSADSIAKAAVKVLSDLASIADSANKTASKQISDSSLISDTVNKSFVKRSTDSTTGSDAAAKSFGRRPADTATISDQLSKAVKKVFGDSATIADLANLSAGRYIVVNDSAVISDAVSKRLTKILQDAVTIDDDIVKAFQLVVNDNADITDEIDKRLRSVGMTGVKVVLRARDLAVRLKDRGVRVSLENQGDRTKVVLQDRDKRTPLKSGGRSITVVHIKD